MGDGIASQKQLADSFAAAHRALRADADIQFDLQRATPPTPAPAWLKAFGEWLGNALRPVGRALDWIGSFLPDAPYARIILWSILIAAAGAVLWMLWTRLREGSWRLPQWRRRNGAPMEPAHEEAWRPEAAPAHDWLDEADALAGQGLYAEATHHLLIRSIQDIGRRRPGLVRPALTSRDLAASTGIPRKARELFAGMAAVVERSLFGGRGVGVEDWERCRSAYADFVRTSAWQSKAAA